MTEQINKIEFPLISLSGLVPLKPRWPGSQPEIFTFWGFFFFSISYNRQFSLHQQDFTRHLTAQHGHHNWGVVLGITECLCEGEGTKGLHSKRSNLEPKFYFCQASSAGWIRLCVIQSHTGQYFHKGFFIVEHEIGV